MTRFRFLAAAVVIAGVVATTPSTRALASASAARQMDHQASTGQAPMMMSDAQMMAMHQKMMVDMKAMDVKLDALVATMNAAKGAAKVDAIAEALTAMVQQHKTMRDGMMQMDGQMMMHGRATMPGGAK
ncbi:MAG: hypothetical protein ABI634_20160 [Acidobacteriota bacterium]